MKYTLSVQQNELTEEYFIILPQELLDRVGWVEGDNIKWKPSINGSFILTKENK
jgi:hypothetical protein